MKKILILLTVISLFLFVACKKTIDGPECSTAVKVDNDIFNNGPKYPVKVQKVTIDHDCLELEISASGCSGSDWNVVLVTGTGYKESIPIIRDIRVSMDSLGLCATSFENTFTFDLTNFRIDSEHKIELKLEGWDQEIIYEY